MALEEDLIPKEPEKSERVPVVGGMIKGKKNERKK